MIHQIMHVLVIYNPVAGAKTLRWNASVIQNFFKQKNVTVTWFETEPKPHHSLDQFQNALFDRIIVIGGDGTVRDVAHFLIKNNIKIPLAIVAQGTGNILATSLNIPIFPIQRALAYAITKNPQPLDVMHINEKYYGLIAAGQGYDSLFIKGATRILKRQFGIFAYIFSFLKTFFRYTTHKYTIVIDGKRHHAVGKLAIVFNILSISGIPIDHAISPQDGIVNLVIVHFRSLWDFIKISASFLCRIPLKKIPKIQTFTGKTISINQKKGKEIQIDGEVFKAQNLQIKVLPKALMIIYDKKFAS